MVTFLCLAVAICAVVVTFFSPLWGWIAYGVPALYLIVQCAIVQISNRNANHTEDSPQVGELSPGALKWFKANLYSYVYPFASREFSKASYYMALLSIVMGIATAIAGSVVHGVVLGMMAFLILSNVAHLYCPQYYITDESTALLHEEVVEFVLAQQRKQRESVLGKKPGTEEPCDDGE